MLGKLSACSRLNGKLPKLKRIYYDAPPTTPDTSERTVTLYEDCSNISLFLVQYQYLGVYGCIATMLCTKSTTAEIKVGDTTTKASVRFVDANTWAIKNTDSGYGINVFGIWL